MNQEYLKSLLDELDRVKEQQKPPLSTHEADLLEGKRLGLLRAIKLLN